MSFFKQGTPVCVEIERHTSNLSEYEFVVLCGNLELVENREEARTIKLFRYSFISNHLRENYAVECCMCLCRQALERFWREGLRER
jgi:nitroimidazol reductase NimA-like FMN-containing flavoprotein (pyridoxamine 5'-phosphate oxidase superfamily)